MNKQANKQPQCAKLNLQQSHISLESSSKSGCGDLLHGTSQVLIDKSCMTLLTCGLNSIVTPPLTKMLLFNKNQDKYKICFLFIQLSSTIIIWNHNLHQKQVYYCFRNNSMLKNLFSSLKIISRECTVLIIFSIE